MASAAPFRRKLHALQYPNTFQFDVNDDKHFRTVVVWLEEVKIRHYEVKDRVPLRAINDDKAWNEAFQKYLVALNCPAPLASPSSPRAGVLQWLLSQAISFEYHDNEQTYNKVQPKALPPIVPSSSGTSSSSSSSAPSSSNGKDTDVEMKAADTDADINTPELHSLMDKLASVVGVPVQADQDVPTKLAIVRRVLLLRVNANAQAKRAPHPQQIRPQEALKKLPLGFTTGDAAVDSAALLLRMLHVAELRELQSQINEVIDTMQNHISDPKTDARLGRVGR